MAVSNTTLAQARIARDLTQTELARRAGISRQALGAIESGAYHPGVAIAIRLARELGATVEALFGEPDAETSTLVEASWSDDARRRPAPRRLASRSRACAAASRRRLHVSPARRNRLDAVDGGMRPCRYDPGGLARAPALSRSRGRDSMLEPGSA